jgi:hypothetical protein
MSARRRATGQPWLRVSLTRAAIATLDADASRSSPSTTPTLSAAERFWLTFHLRQRLQQGIAAPVERRCRQRPHCSSFDGAEPDGSTHAHLPLLNLLDHLEP